MPPPPFAASSQSRRKLKAFQFVEPNDSASDSALNDVAKGKHSMKVFGASESRSSEVSGHATKENQAGWLNGAIVPGDGSPKKRKIGAMAATTTRQSPLKPRPVKQVGEEREVMVDSIKPPADGSKIEPQTPARIPLKDLLGNFEDAFNSFPGAESTTTPDGYVAWEHKAPSSSEMARWTSTATPASTRRKRARSSSPASANESFNLGNMRSSLKTPSHKSANDANDDLLSRYKNRNAATVDATASGNADSLVQLLSSSPQTPGMIKRVKDSGLRRSISCGIEFPASHAKRRRVINEDEKEKYTRARDIFAGAKDDILDPTKTTSFKVSMLVDKIQESLNETKHAQGVVATVVKLGHEGPLLPRETSDEVDAENESFDSAPSSSSPLPERHSFRAPSAAPSRKAEHSRKSQLETVQEESPPEKDEFDLDGSSDVEALLGMDLDVSVPQLQGSHPVIKDPGPQSRSDATNDGGAALDNFDSSEFGDDDLDFDMVEEAEKLSHTRQQPVKIERITPGKSGSMRFNDVLLGEAQSISATMKQECGRNGIKLQEQQTTMATKAPLQPLIDEFDDDDFDDDDFAAGIDELETQLRSTNAPAGPIAVSGKAQDNAFKSVVTGSSSTLLTTATAAKEAEILRYEHDSHSDSKQNLSDSFDTDSDVFLELIAAEEGTPESSTGEQIAAEEHLAAVTANRACQNSCWN